MTTWYDIKLATLQKMFAAEGTTIPTDESTKEYVASMPYACNEALQLIATAGKFIIKSVSIAHFPVPNLIDDGIAKQIHTIYAPSVFEVSSKKTRSLTFDVLGTGKLDIFVGENLVQTDIIDSPKGFTEYKQNSQNMNGDEVRLLFTPGNQMSVKAIGMYECSFPDEKDIPPYKKNIRYAMREYASDYYQIDNNQIFYEGDAKEEYLQTSEYFQEGNKVLVLPRDKRGNYTIYYKAYPEQITQETDDAYVFPIDDEVATLIPLYMASQLYKDDDNGIATSYRNEFEIAFERLSQKTNVPVAEHFVSESGWI